MTADPSTDPAERRAPGDPGGGVEAPTVLRTMIESGPVKTKMLIVGDTRTGLKDANVWGTLPGATDEEILIFAHHDAYFEGAIDNASGVGVQVALAPELADLRPACDVWLVATGSEERQVTGLPYHAGAAALVKQVKNEGRGSDLRFALSLDEVGLGKRFYLRSPAASIRSGVEGEILSAARRAAVTVHWARDSGTGNSDHREFELAGLPGAVLEVWRGDFACHHLACDRPRLLQKPAMKRAVRIAGEVVKGG